MHYKKYFVINADIDAFDRREDAVERARTLLATHPGEEFLIMESIARARHEIKLTPTDEIAPKEDRECPQ